MPSRGIFSYMLCSYKFCLFLFYKGVGDGGNELGMGKVKDAVKKHIKNGDVIACDVEADFTVVAGKRFLVGWEST